jgi:hypothetical protein
VPDGLFVLHTCDFGLCCNPEHLYLGTQADNVADIQKRKRGNPPCGVRNAWAVLTDIKVRKIRKAAARGVLQKILAAQFGVARPVISNVVNRKAWKHVA